MKEIKLNYEGKEITLHKDERLFDAGYIHAPYLPLLMLPKIAGLKRIPRKTKKRLKKKYGNEYKQHANKFTGVVGIMTRYATKMVNNKFYGKVLVDKII